MGWKCLEPLFIDFGGVKAETIHCKVSNITGLSDVTDQMVLSYDRTVQWTKLDDPFAFCFQWTTDFFDLTVQSFLHKTDSPMDKELILFPILFLLKN